MGVEVGVGDGLEVGVEVGVDVGVEVGVGGGVGVSNSRVPVVTEITLCGLGSRCREPDRSCHWKYECCGSAHSVVPLKTGRSVCVILVDTRRRNPTDSGSTSPILKS